MWGVRVVHEKFFVAPRIGLPSQQGVENESIDGVSFRHFISGELQESRQDIDHGRLLRLDGPGGNRKAFLMQISLLRARPRGDEWHSHAPFIMRSFAPPQGSGAGHFVR